jgi:CRISPR-associated protein Csc3
MTEEHISNLDETEDELPPQEKKAEIAEVPLFSALLKDVVSKLWAGDAVMSAFVEEVAAPISDELGTVAAKGGIFAEQHLAEGRKRVDDYIKDQSMRAHLINGLFPVLHLAHTLKTWGAPRFRAYDDQARRVFMAGYVLHDFLKLPGVDKTLEAAGFSHDKAIGAEQMPTLEAIFSQWCETLGLNKFLQPEGGAGAVIHDLIYVACNTQVRWGTMRNLSKFGGLRLSPAQLSLAEDLSHLSDLLAYVIKTPSEATANAGIQDDISTLSNGMARLTYHHLADNRGVLTNFIHNAALNAMTGEFRVPLLYAPSGVVYLENKKLAPEMPTATEIADATIKEIKVRVGAALETTQNGIKRDGKGMKYASYYWLFFELAKFIQIGHNATFKVIKDGKKPSSGNRFEKMRSGNWMPASVDLDLPNDLRVDQLAEWCYLAEKQISDRLPNFATGSFLLAEMGLSELEDEFNAVPRDNRAGGVGYHWYFAAGHYIKRHAGLSPADLLQKTTEWALSLSKAVEGQLSATKTEEYNDWDDLREYICRNLTLGGGTNKPDLRAALETELINYSSAKRKGRGTTQVCALCSSSYRVDKQREAAVLFAPQVYSNKKPLNGSDAIRDICSICSMEMMLRQILMNRSAASGGDFEGRRVRYLFFYPMYFFTPETLELVRSVANQIKRPSITDLRAKLVNKETGAVDFSPKTLQRVQEFLFSNVLDPAADRYVRLRFHESDTVVFDFLGVPPPSRDPKDAESWIHPALLSLLLPVCLDVKVVASEASIPLLLEADEIKETIFLDAPHAAIQYLLNGQTRLVIDKILPAAQRLLASYFIHVDANAVSGAGGFDYRWQDIPAVARALAESPLYAFHYLKKWQRKQKLDSLPAKKVAEYLQYITYLGDDPMTNHARELTQLYRQFYRAKRWNSNSILQPVSKTARAILDADPQMFGTAQALTDAVYGSLHAFIDRAYSQKLAFPPRGSTRESQQAAMRAFVTYFVNDIFFGVFRGDKSAFRGKQLNLLKNACEVIYLDEAAKDKAEREQVEMENAETK